MKEGRIHIRSKEQLIPLNTVNLRNKLGLES